LFTLLRSRIESLQGPLLELAAKMDKQSFIGRVRELAGE
jgi:hypothetical protein